jgi:hypothetical protein
MGGFGGGRGGRWVVEWAGWVGALTGVVLKRQRIRHFCDCMPPFTAAKFDASCLPALWCSLLAGAAAAAAATETASSAVAAAVVAAAAAAAASFRSQVGANCTLLIMVGLHAALLNWLTASHPASRLCI